MAFSRAMKFGAVCILGALALTGCTSGDYPKRMADRPTAVPENVPANLARFYREQLNWTTCQVQPGDTVPAGQECASLKVPLDWAAPEGETITIALARMPATGKNRQGSLLVNPGGPGGSGIAALNSISQSVSSSVRAHFDLVAFDPRGVGASTAVNCLDDQGLDAFRAESIDPTAPNAYTVAKQSYAAFGKACQSNTGALLGHVDTVSAARDMDVIRAALDEAQLDYLGFSYGTFLGATYAGLFPQKVGRFVLDGAIDPTLTSAQMNVQQLTAFEKALRAYVSDCLQGATCPLSGSVDHGMAQIRQLLARIQKVPLATTTSRKLTASLAVAGIALPLYDDQTWPVLTSALEAALVDNDGTGLLGLADASADRKANGTYSTNSVEANAAINCLDLPAGDTSQNAIAKDAQALIKASPTFGPYFAYTDLSCASWPVPSTGHRTEITADGASPIVVIGTTGDPATPYAWAKSLAGQLSSGVLVTYKGQGHTAYGRSNSCITDAVDAYLTKGTAPKDGLTC